MGTCVVGGAGIPTIMNEHHGGNPALHLPLSVIERQILALAAAPQNVGRVRVVVARKPEEGRESVTSARLTSEGGLHGDKWVQKAKMPQQITMMEHEPGQVIANGQSMTLFGDNLLVDLDLGAANLPVGSRVRVGTAELVVTEKPHTGCSKYKARFGADALSYISDKLRKPRRLRGIHLRVVVDGEVAVGDDVRVMLRAEPEASAHLAEAGEG